MLKKICLIIVLILSISVVSYADEIEIENFPEEELWEEIESVNKSSKSDEPKLNSRAAIVFDRTSKTVIYGKNIDEKRAMASTTKIMTAIIVLENGNLSDPIEVCKKAANTGGSRLGLKENDKITLNDLLYGLMLRSGNDAAVQIAIHLGGSVEGFAELMNNKAKELGLKNTNFVTPHGLDDPNHYTTAYELAVLTDYALNIEKFAEIVNTKTTTININGNPVTINNTNELLGYLNGVDGVKTGFTNNAGRCLVTSTTRNNWQIISVVLGADTKKFRTKDSIELIEYAFENYKQVNIKEKVENDFNKWREDNEGDIKIIKGSDNRISTTINYSYDYEMFPVKNGNMDNVKIQVEVEKQIEAPIEINTEIGKLHVIVENKEIMNIPIVTAEEIRRKGIFEYFTEIIKDYMCELESIVDKI